MAQGMILDNQQTPAAVTEGGRRPTGVTAPPLRGFVPPPSHRERARAPEESFSSAALFSLGFHRLAEAVAFAIHLEDVTMVRQAVQ
jgi:hypothetical protein